MNIIRTIITRLATMPHTRAFILGSIDTAEERSHFRGMLVELGIPSVVALLLFANFGMSPVQDAPVVGPAFDEVLPDAGITILARAPGTDPLFALNFCNDPATRVEMPGPVDDGRITLSRGTDTLSWAGNNALTAYYQSATEGVPVDMTKQAAECFTKKAKR